MANSSTPSSKLTFEWSAIEPDCDHGLCIAEDPMDQIRQASRITAVAIFVVLIVSVIWGLSDVFIKKKKKPGKKKIIVSIICSIILAIFLVGFFIDDLTTTEITMPAKPVIYLYPEQETEVTVDLDYQGELTFTYPEIADGWRVTAYPDGKLINHADNREYSYLFWEGQNDSGRQYDWSQGFVVKGTDTREFLQKTLAQIGLTPKEYNEFIVYWYPQLATNKYNLIHFANDQEYGQYAKLNISPQPDSILRVFMVFKPLNQPLTVTPQQFTPFNRTGFTVVEWGGSSI